MGFVNYQSVELLVNFLFDMYKQFIIIEIHFTHYNMFSEPNTQPES